MCGFVNIWWELFVESEHYALIPSRSSWFFLFFQGFPAVRIGQCSVCAFLLGFFLVVFCFGGLALLLGVLLRVNPESFGLLLLLVLLLLLRL